MRLTNLFKFRNIIKIIFNPHLVLITFIYNTKRILSDAAAFFGIYKYKYNIIFLAGMPMSATTLVKNMFGLIPGYYTRTTPIPYDVHVKNNFCDSAFQHCPKNGFTIFKTHMEALDKNIEIIRRHNVKRVIVTYRDLRDVTISRYHRLLNVKDAKFDTLHYIDYGKLNKEDAINHSISIVAAHYVPWIKRWFEIAKKHNHFVHFCKFEMLRVSPEKEFSKMLEFYEIKLSQKKIFKIIEKTKGRGLMKKNMYQSALLPWALSTNFRSGKIGNWKTEFTEENKRKFKSLAGDFLIELGYEKNNSW